MLEWAEFHADGVLAVHCATAEHRPGTIDIHLLVEDLDAAASALSSFALERQSMEGVGEMLVARASSGIAISVSEGAAQGGVGDIAVQPIWFQADLAEPRAILEALGLRGGIASDRGGWVEMLGDGGSVGLPRVRPGSGCPSRRAAIWMRSLPGCRMPGSRHPSSMKLSRGRSCIPDPDGGDEIWINSVQDDLHGYHRA